MINSKVDLFEIATRDLSEKKLRHLGNTKEFASRLEHGELTPVAIFEALVDFVNTAEWHSQISTASTMTAFLLASSAPGHAMELPGLTFDDDDADESDEAEPYSLVGAGLRKLITKIMSRVETGDAEDRKVTRESLRSGLEKGRDQYAAHEKARSEALAKTKPKPSAKNATAATDDLMLPYKRQAWRSADFTDVPEGITALEFGRTHQLGSEYTLPVLLELMNKQHAVVRIGKTTRYLTERKKSDSDQMERAFLSAEDIRRLYSNVVVPAHMLPTFHITLPGKVTPYVNAFDVWNAWSERRIFDGVGFYPGKMFVPKGLLNLWQGFARTAVKGDWSRYEKHLRTHTCNGDKKIFTWLMDWLAHCLQRPYEKPRSAIVLKSDAKGTGKSMLFAMMHKVLGDHAYSTAHEKHVTGNFNAHLKTNIVMALEEAMWAGDKKGEGVLKDLITTRSTLIEEKGLDAYMLDNFTRVMIFTNNRWAAPVGINERRFLVLNVSEEDANDDTYFDPIWKQMLDEGGVEAMMHDLLHRNITSNLGSPPETEALRDERAHSLDGLRRWLLEVAQDGCIETRDGDKQLKDSGETKIEIGAVRHAAQENLSQYERRGLRTNLGNLLRDVGVKKERPWVAGKVRERVYVFPPLEQFRRNVEALLKTTVGRE